MRAAPERRSVLPVGASPSRYQIETGNGIEKWFSVIIKIIPAGDVVEAGRVAGTSSNRINERADKSDGRIARGFGLLIDQRHKTRPARDAKLVPP